jgi:hypothetical protein
MSNKIITYVLIKYQGGSVIRKIQEQFEDTKRVIRKQNSKTYLNVIY